MALDSAGTISGLNSSRRSGRRRDRIRFRVRPGSALEESRQPGEAPLLQVGFHVAPAHPQQGADEQPLHHRVDSGKTAGPRAPDQPQEKGLGLVVPGVAQGHPLCPGLAGHLLQKGVPGTPGGRLQAILRALQRAREKASGRERGGRAGRRGIRTNSSSRSDSAPRRAWFRWATARSKGDSSLSRRKRSRRQVESAPPETAARTRVPGVHIPSRARAALNESKRSGDIVFGGGAGIRTPDAADMSRVL